MLKIGIVGMERIGKTTLIHETISLLQKQGIECLFLPEITMQPNTISAPMGSPISQRPYIFEQMAQEDKMMASELDKILIVDRTPLDSLIYYIELEDKPIAENVIDFVYAWMRTYDLIFHIETGTLEAIKLNQHYTKVDAKKRVQRAEQMEIAVDVIERTCNVVRDKKNLITAKHTANSIAELYKESL